MANKKENKNKNPHPPKEKKTIAEQIQVRLAQLDKKSSNISKQINILQNRVDNANKLKPKIERLKDELAKIRRAKELELDETALMCSTYANGKQVLIEEEKSPKTAKDLMAESAYAKLA